MCSKLSTKHLAFLACFLPFAAYSQIRTGFTINGHIDGLQNGEKVLMIYRSEFPKTVRIDSCFVVNDGDINLKGGRVENGPAFYTLIFTFGPGPHRVRNETLKRNVGGMECNLFVDNGDSITIQGSNINNMPKADFTDQLAVSGSPSHFAWSSLKVVEDLFVPIIFNLNQKLAKVVDSIGFDRAMIGGIIEAKNSAYEELGKYLLNYGHALYKPAMPILLEDLEGQLNEHASFEMDVFNSLDEKTKHSEAGMRLQAFARLAIGQSLPGFTLPTPEGQQVALSNVIAKSKLTLLHIWASNSVERAQYQQDLKVQYKKYHERGLNIIGISADGNQSKWVSTISKEEYPWINVSDLKGNQKGSIVNDLYLEGGHRVPNTTNILLDGNGKILAWDPNGAVLQYYLWKYLGD